MSSFGLSRYDFKVIEKILSAAVSNDRQTPRPAPRILGRRKAAYHKVLSAFLVIGPISQFLLDDPSL
jgi:hypothetical protein